MQKLFILFIYFLPQTCHTTDYETMILQQFTKIFEAKEQLPEQVKLNTDQSNIKAFNNYSSKIQILQNEIQHLANLDKQTYNDLIKHLTNPLNESQAEMMNKTLHTWVQYFEENNTEIFSIISKPLSRFFALKTQQRNVFFCTIVSRNQRCTYDELRKRYGRPIRHRIYRHFK